MNTVFQLHADILFARNVQGDMTAVNDWRQSKPAPLFYLGRSGDERIIRFRSDSPEGVRTDLATLVAKESSADGMPGQIDEMLGVLAAFDNPSDRMGPAYYFSERIDSAAPQIQIITERNAEVLKPCMSDWLPDVAHEQPMVGWIEDGAALGICASVRRSAKAVAAGLEVVEAARRRGIGMELAKSWASRVMDEGKIAMYSTSSDNIASQGVAARLGLRFLGTDFHVSEQSS